MKDFKNFFRRDSEDSSVGGAVGIKKPGADGKFSVAIFSDFFCTLSGNLFCTNAMYAALKNELIASVDIYDPRQPLIADIFESAPSDEQTRELALIGFRRYLQACLQKKRLQYRSQLMQLTACAAFGVLLIFIVFGVKPAVANWVASCIEIAGTMLIWQYVGFWAFERPALKRKMNQLKQLLALEYRFKTWE